MRSGGLLRKVVAVGRMTAEDSAELATVFAQVAGRQGRDALVALRSRLAHGGRLPGRAARGARASSPRPGDRRDERAPGGAGHGEGPP